MPISGVGGSTASLLTEKALSNQGRTNSLEKLNDPLEAKARSKQGQVNRFEQMAGPLEARALSKQGQSNTLARITAPLEAAATRQLSGRDATNGTPGVLDSAASQLKMPAEGPPAVTPGKLDIKA
jgi:hypothetical protein